MITRRLFAIELILLAGMSTVFFLPSAPTHSPAGIAMKLPIWVGNWLGEDTAVTEKERDVLAKDTKFARKIYTSPEGDKVFVSIVLSGDDMTTSIHRPERCLPAQGWNLLRSSERTVTVPDSGPLRVTRLSNAREVSAEEKGFTLHNLTYYWFIGYDAETPSHFSRTMIDLRDRVLHGFDQRWAYITVAATVTEGIARPERSQAETGAMIEDFIKKLVPKLTRPSGAPLRLASKSS
jgi:EpsI family protein